MLLTRDGDPCKYLDENRIHMGSLLYIQPKVIVSHAPFTLFGILILQNYATPLESDHRIGKPEHLTAT